MHCSVDGYSVCLQKMSYTKSKVKFRSVTSVDYIIHKGISYLYPHLFIMKKILLPVIAMLTLNSFAQDGIRLHRYPFAKKDEVKDTYFGKTIEDPYRWLEDDHSALTANWVLEQNGMTNDYLGKIPFRDKINLELKRLWNYVRYASPIKAGEYYFYYKNDGLQNQSILYIQKGLSGEPRVFIDPNKLNEEGTSSLGSVNFSKNQKYCALSVSGAGSDWQDILVMTVENGKFLSDTIRYSKFSGVSWKGDEGFYYSGYDKPKKESEKYSAKTEFQKIFYHQIGTPQSSDLLIYEDKDHPLRYKGCALSEDERFLMLSLSEGTDGSELQFRDLKNPNQKEFQILCKGFTLNQEFVDMHNQQFIVYSNWHAPKYQLLLIDPNKPDEKNWKVLVPEKASKLESVSRVGNQLFCNYLENACSKVDVYDLKGQLIRTIDLPGLGTASGFGGRETDDHTFYTYTSYNTPPVIYHYDLKSGKSTIFKNTTVAMDLSNTVVTQMWFKSKDGTKVPMFVYHRADIDLKKGPHPVFLYGYGGFNISLTPSFSIPMSYFVQKGGIYVSVSLRGGGEFGEEWHKAGMLENKQNVFDDFIGAAEYLIKQGITTKDQIAIHGRSNGGLLVGACMTQRPDLFKVALPGVGVLDMLRYHKFTVGWGWAVEYGSSDQEKDFNYLLKYSPVHQVKSGVDYPATLITTADHDDRVVPAHSFKFAATLQEKNPQQKPMLIRIETQAGHGAGKSTSKQINEWADIMTFVFHHLNMDGFK